MINSKYIFRFFLMISIIFYSCEKAGNRSLSFGKALHPFPEKKMLSRDLGFLLYEPATGTVIHSHNSARGKIPASVTKVATTAAALDVLGEYYRFKTELAYTGTIRGRILHGNLYIKGFGDPFLHIRDLMRMREFLAKTGITNIRGKFIYDESFFCKSASIDRKMDADAAYNPGFSALSSAYNSIKAHYTRIAGTKKTRIFLTPQLDHYSVRSSPVVSWLTTQFTPDKNSGWTQRAASRASGNKRLPIKRPSLFTASLFARLCSICGIRLPAPLPGKKPDMAAVIYTHRSLPLTQLVDITMAYSDNLMAELLMLQCAKKLGKKPTSLRDAGHALSSYYKKKMPRINWKGLRLANGSGLTPDNRISPEQMIAFLHFGLNLHLKKRSFLTLLLPSGMSWSLGKRLNRPDTALRVWAKTGTIFYAVSLTGVLYTKSGKRMLFAVMYSDNQKQKEFRRFKSGRKRELALKKAIRWVREKKQRIDRIVEYWIKNI